MNWWTQQKLKCRIAQIRLRTVERVAARKGSQVVKFLGPMVADPDREVRKAVIQALSGSHDKLAVASLVSALRDSERELRFRAAKALEAAGWKPDSDEQSVWRAVACYEFVKAADFGSVAVEPLIAELEDLHSPNRLDVIRLLGQMGDSRAIRPLLVAVSDPDPNIRVAAVDGLNGVDDPDVVASLINAIKDPSKNVRAVAAAALGKAADAAAVEPLVAVLTDEDWAVRKAAGDALARLRDKRAVEPMIGLINDHDPDVRETAVHALGEIRDRSAVESLVRALVDPQLSVRTLAASALRKIDSQWEKLEQALRVIPRLRVALRSNDYWVRQAASEVLATLDKSHVPATQLDRPDSNVIRVRQQVAFGVLVKALSDHDPILRFAAAEALGRAADRRLIPPLVGALADPKPWVRHSAALALEKMSWTPADDSEQALHRAALRALSPRA
jgi:HEAT repeat protein